LDSSPARAKQGDLNQNNWGQNNGETGRQNDFVLNYFDQILSLVAAMPR
jgi:hypothetical protein